MAGGEAAVDEHRLDRVGEREQSQRVGDRGAALAEPSRELFLREPVLVDEMLKAGGLFERIEVLALQILDDRKLEGLAVVARADDRRESSAACSAAQARQRRSPAISS